MKIQNQGFDHVEFVVNDIESYTPMYKKMGFEKTGERHLVDRGTRTAVFSQGLIRILLTQPDGLQVIESQVKSKDEAIRFLTNHAEGICTLALDVEDAAAAFHETTSRGARPAMAPKTFHSPQGSVVRAEVWTPGDLRYAFIQRSSSNDKTGPALFDEGLVVSRLESPSPLGLHTIDHLTNNVGMGQTETWRSYYQKVFGFIVSRHFDIHTTKTGLISDVIQSEDGRVKFPINEATEPQSQVQEFVDRMKGPGVQHLALSSDNILNTIRGLREHNYKFLTVPHTYYEVVPTRVPGVSENIGELESLGILLDGDKTGYLLQIFSEEMVGPFFFEYIQRKGNQGFGEGNFRALFEAMERDQVKRGVLSA